MTPAIYCGKHFPQDLAIRCSRPRGHPGEHQNTIREDGVCYGWEDEPDPPVVGVAHVPAEDSCPCCAELRRRDDAADYARAYEAGYAAGQTIKELEARVAVLSNALAAIYNVAEPFFRTPPGD